MKISKEKNYKKKNYKERRREKHDKFFKLLEKKRLKFRLKTKTQLRRESAGKDFKENGKRGADRGKKK